ncbi:FlgO family outer membrane protein [Neptuniibacter sp. SY11_33]|uniref:FlgO family outer membrane protein n=1 Tax=Neptuniibacter sp. SY11_33 TaxID=3398215 RepID=UPI0039F449E8
MRKLLSALLIGVTLITAGCASDKAARSKPTEQKVDLVGVLSDARNPLFNKLLSPLSKDQAIMTASFANIDNLSSSSTFGRMAAEVISAGLTKRGYKVIEVKMRDSLFIKQRAGEFMLSRQLQNISQQHDAQAVLLGTYAIGGENLYVNARLVRTVDNIVLSSHDFVLPLNRDIKRLLGGR